MRSLVVGLLVLRGGEASVERTAKMAFRPTLNGSVAMAYRSTSKLIFVLACAIGKAFIESNVSPVEVRAFLKEKLSE